MIDKVKDSLDAGVEKLKWFSTTLSERVKVELAVFKLLSDLKKLEKQRNDEALKVGLRLFELKGRQSHDVMKDQTVKKALAEMARISEEIETLRADISEIGKPEA